MERCGSVRMPLSFSIVVVAYGLATTPVVADIVPESLRIQQNAKKAYSRKPVVPINRGNAHRRDLDLGRDLGASGGSDGVSPQRAYPTRPNGTIVPPVQSDPKATTPH